MIVKPRYRATPAAIMAGRSPTMSQHEPPSPCNRVCRIDPATGWCLGCSRTLAEIADWAMLSAGEKRALLAQIAERRPGGG
jgi:predicted Fe-S protein YdhL (DUF1289 family)